MGGSYVFISAAFSDRRTPISTMLPRPLSQNRTSTALADYSFETENGSVSESTFGAQVNQVAVDYCDHSEKKTRQPCTS